MQLEQHAESRLRRHQLADHARTLGWPEARCPAINDDPGLSGARSANRPAYQQLVSPVAPREVGIIFGREVSPLARNCLDRYRLPGLAAAFAVPIGDEDGLYDPGDFNDRLQLGLKGTFSEIERYQIQRGGASWPWTGRSASSTTRSADGSS